jgi:hypothetical protein
MQGGSYTKHYNHCPSIGTGGTTRTTTAATERKHYNTIATTMAKRNLQQLSEFSTRTTRSAATQCIKRNLSSTDTNTYHQLPEWAEHDAHTNANTTNYDINAKAEAQHRGISSR